MRPEGCWSVCSNKTGCSNQQKRKSCCVSTDTKIYDADGAMDLVYLQGQTFVFIWEEMVYLTHELY